MQDNNAPPPHLLRKIVRQRNHDGGTIPPCLKEYASHPLYVLIAIWCWRQKKWIDRQLISEAFHITTRRASFMMTYILSHNEFITADSRKARLSHTGRIRLEIKVVGIELDKILARSTPPGGRSQKLAHSKECQHYWRWVLSRQVFK